MFTHMDGYMHIYSIYKVYGADDICDTHTHVYKCDICKYKQTTLENNMFLFRCIHT